MMALKKKCISILLIVLMVFASGCGGGAAGESLDELLSLGQKYLLEENYEEAIVAFEKAIQIDKKCVDAYLGMSDAYIGLGDTDKAIEILKQGLEQLPDNEEIKAMLDKLADSEASAPFKVRQGEYIEESGEMKYKFNLVDGVPQPMGTSSVEGPHGSMITETVMAYMSDRQSEGGEWSDWEVAPHYWAGLVCSDCGEFPEDGSMPEWFYLGFSHPWSGEWAEEPRVFYEDQ